ncbi:hypothetical protein K505DRAFT_255683 [Melanomma pulvis-pyrius CBS 109.77]|uniref:Uncharacterized protein n=1 Tax=Melanomma pulvis-pyrius CBS 109.77 TaxID=1314802 RepID=A0A6A6WWT9_9PLEO|nr:hypothetical protein K505DRAFT_255683 [Melanomma pulvis-pyrius CBS 109.77]
MGRQAYLTKIALGRSAFEPSQSSVTPSSGYVQLEPSQQDIPPAARESNINKYTQLYDERGNPINPRAYEHGRRFREAQNDVLSSIGVVQRRRSPSEDLPGSYEERLEQLYNEDSVGNAIARTSMLTENACSWWIGSLRDRILTFRFREAAPFSQIVAAEYQVSGSRLVYGGFASRLLSAFSVQASFNAASELRPLDRLLLALRVSQKTRFIIRKWRKEINLCFRMMIELAFYPFAYHANLQRLGLFPAKQLPYWRAFIPFSKWSPIKPFLLYPVVSATTPTSVMGKFMVGLKAGIMAPLTSPLVFLVLEHFLEQWIYAAIQEATDTTIIHPNNPDLMPPDDGIKYRAAAMVGPRKKSPSVIRNTINNILVAIGWGTVPSSEATDGQPSQAIPTTGVEVPQNLEVGGRQVTNINRLQLPLAHPSSSSDVNGLIVPFNLSGEVVSLPTPPSPTASEASQDDSDPRIRITSREGIVEMEVRLPPHVLATHADISGTTPGSPNQRNIASPIPVGNAETQTYHRVTQLSTEPSQMIGAIFKSQIVGWATMPLRLVTLRLVAGHFVASNPGHIALRHVLAPLPSVHDWSLRSVGLLLSRVALCGAVEVAIDLGLWGIQWMVVQWMGKSFFGWGTL